MSRICESARLRVGSRFPAKNFKQLESTIQQLPWYQPLISFILFLFFFFHFFLFPFSFARLLILQYNRGDYLATSEKFPDIRVTSKKSVLYHTSTPPPPSPLFFFYPFLSPFILSSSSFFSNSSFVEAVEERVREILQKMRKKRSGYKSVNPAQGGSDVHLRLQNDYAQVSSTRRKRRGGMEEGRSKQHTQRSEERRKRGERREREMDELTRL